MKEFEIEVGSLVTINENEIFTVKAETFEEAKEKAIKKFISYLNDKYSFVDCDSFEVDCISKTEL